MNKKISTGAILLAEPFMIDSNFKRAVVLVCDHTKKDGTVGFVLNKNLGLQITDLIHEFPHFESEIYYGGPVQTESIHYIHNVGNILDNSTKVIDGVWWGGDFEKLKFLITTQLIRPENIRFFVGYSGWSANQLTNELKLGSWVVSEMHANYLFKSKPNALWQQVMKNKGDRFEVIADMPDVVNWN